MKRTINVLVGVALGFSALHASAAMYSVDELFLGTFEVTGNQVIHDLNFLSILSGEAGIFSSGLTTVIDDNTAACTPSTCTFEEVFIGGDTITGHFSFNAIGLNGPTELIYGGDVVITGGTGAFVNATGTGTFSGTDNFLTQTTGTTTHRSIFTVDTNVAVAAVPEPEAYAMFLVGLGLLGFVSRRRK